MPPNKEIYEAFVSMPFGSDAKSKRYWNDFYNALSDVSGLLSTRPYSINFRRADDTVNALELKEHVMKLIRDCDFTVAIITGSNPNVFWEAGFAQCLDKPIVFVIEADEHAAQRSPVLVSATLKHTYDGKIFDVVPQDKAKVHNFQRSLLPFLGTAIEIVNGQIERPAQHYVFSGRESAHLAKIIIEAERTIDLITSNLSYFADVNNFRDESTQEFPFDVPIKKGIKVRILTLDPDSPIAAYRARQLGRVHDVAGYREELRSSARFFYQRYQTFRNVDIRIYDDLPLQITLLVDDQIITSVMSRGNQSRDNIHLYFDLDFKGARTSFQGHFSEVLANQAQTVHIANLAWARLLPHEDKPDPRLVNSEIRKPPKAS